MNDSQTQPVDDESFPPLQTLASLDRDAAAVDAAALDRTRSAATAAFEAAGNAPLLERSALVDATASIAASRPSRRAGWMLGATAAAVVVAGWFAVQPGGLPTNLAFGDVLKRLNEADTLQLKVVRDGQSADVFIRQPGVVRWEESPSRYRIARGSRLWEIDASAATDPQSQQNPWFGPRGEVDLLAMVNIHPTDRASLLQAAPTGRDTYAGKPCLVFRRSVSTDGRAVRLEAFVDAESQSLVGLIARDPDAARDGPPLAELTLIALNPAVDESLFKIPVHLAETDRIGKLTDLQGIVVLRPVGARRWTPLCRETLVQAGDWLRTDVRGANAATVELASQQKLVIGPGSLVEVISPTEVRLHAGIVQVVRPAETPQSLTLRGLGDAVLTLEQPGETLHCIDGSQLAAVEQKPRWLEGYEGSSAEDSIGSLIVNIDGRNEPLTVGEHHVTVEIRDQIARTTIEETFVNHTDRRMEGTFHFPLPQDASISGFGMWIGNELVEADIVEKQRAREIYETILREKRDPGLLEWTGGNIFKARVFPIEAHSEKRVKIVYTQVLPLRGNRFRYSYGLRSEMLSLHPLRELNIRVLVNSAVPLAQVESPTHTCRTQQTAHSAELEFTAQEYTPERDFEVVCEVNHRENDVVAIPHQRGEDGYFLLQLMPPGGGNEGDWQRELIPDGDPLELILLCDTSGSMDSTMRQAQAEFVASVLAALGDKDRFTLAACDVSTVWAFDGYVPANDENVTKVRQFLDDRVSLGWTDLDQAFAAVLKKATPQSHVLYIGDGIVSTGNADPAAFVNRLQRLWAVKDQGSRIEDRGDSQATPTHYPLPTTHSISVGSTYESVVLKGIAGLSGGSMRQISGETTPQETALELLNEIAQPGLKDVQVEFRGVKVAAVYPESLPNIPAGTQQILVGRYLPEEGNQTGEIVVTGNRNGEPVKYVAKIELAEAEQGNSFIPRLWARARLDQLLQQGSSPQIQDEIIGLSEEFHIITPYTSLLVLESDADRERFGVQRRFEMRDGEKFFAEGRDNANYELRQQQMQRAGNWRLGLRRQILARLARLGRDPEVFAAWGGAMEEELLREEQILGTRVYDVSAMVMPLMKSKDSWDYNGRSDVYLSESEYALGDDFSSGGLPELRLIAAQRQPDDYYAAIRDADSDGGLGVPADELMASFDAPSEIAFDGLEPQLSADGGVAYHGAWDEVDLKAVSRFDAHPEPVRLQEMQQNFAGGTFAGRGVSLAKRGRYAIAAQASVGQRGNERFLRRAYLDIAGKAAFLGEYGQSRYGQAEYEAHRQLLDNLFPYLPPAQKPMAEGEQKATKATKELWSDEAKNLAASLLREEALRKLEGGVRIERRTASWDGAWDRLVPSNSRTELWSPGRWVTRDHGQGVQPVLNYCDAETRGVLSEAFLLGRRRKSTPEDIAEQPLYLPDHSLHSLHESYKHYTAAVEHPAADRAVLVLTSDSDADATLRFTIDTTRHVVVRFEQRHKALVTQTMDFTDFVETAGGWWATRITLTNGAETHPAYVTTQTITQLDAARFNADCDNAVARSDAVQFISMPLPELRLAKQAVADGRGTFDDRIILLADLCARQQWELAYAELKAADAAATVTHGLPWLRGAVHRLAGRNADYLQWLTQFVPTIVALGADQAAAGPPTIANDADLFLTEHVLSTAYSITSWQEYGPLVAALKPVYERQGDREVSLLEWNEQQLSVLNALDLDEEALALAKAIAAGMPGDPQRQISYVQRLVEMHRDEEGLEHLRLQLALPHWEPSERLALRENYAVRLENRGETETLLAFLKEWLAEEPTHSGPYARYLTALVMSDDLAASDAAAQEWLDLVAAAGELTEPQAARFEAAIQYCVGNGHRLYRYNGMDPRWRLPLLKAAMICVPRLDRQQFAAQFVTDGRFDQTDEGDRLRGHLLGWLLDGAATMPVDPLAMQIGWLRRGRLLVGDGDQMEIRPFVTDAEWTQLADQLLARWVAETVDERRQALALLLDDLHSHSVLDRRLPFVRRVIAEGAAKHRPHWQALLFSLLQSQPWTEAMEAEAFALWPTLVETADQPQPLKTWTRVSGLVPPLYELVDAMLRNRVAAAERALQDAGQTDELTRMELAAKQTEFLKSAREGVAARLGTLLADRAEDDDELIPWLQLEQAWLDLLLDRNRDAVLQTCWGLLGDAPPKPAAGEEPRMTEAELIEDTLQSALRQRAWAMVEFCAARRHADPALIDRVLAYIDAGIELSAISGQKSGENEQSAPADNTLNTQRSTINASWKQTKHDFLIALDRPDELVAELRRWIETDRPNAHWRRALARLLAERGELPEAATLFEALRTENELAASDLRTLADWQLALDRRAEYDRGRIEQFKQMEAWQLANLLQQQAQQLNSGGGPHELDEITLFMLYSLFEKTNKPGNHFHVLRELYMATRDFRLLERVPESVLGRTQQQVYAALSQLENSVLAELRSEATADEAVAFIAKRRAELLAGVVPRGADPNERSLQLDLRALDLIEAQIERKCAEVLNEPGPHVEKALIALRRAFDREWGPGERLQMATLLAALGQISQAELAAEQLRQLEQLYNDSEPHSMDRARIGAAHALLLFNGYSRRPEALTRFEAVLRELAEPTDGLIPEAAADLVTSYSSCLQTTGAYLQAEAYVQKQWDGAATESLKQTYVDHLNLLHFGALQFPARTSLGEGAELYRGLTRRLLDQCNTTDDNRRYSLLYLLIQVYGTGCSRKLDGAKDEFLRFADVTLPELLQTQQYHHGPLVSHAADWIYRELSPLDALRFLLARVEQYPPRYRVDGNDPWHQHGYSLASYRIASQAAPPNASPPELAELEERLLPLVLAELRRELISQQSRSGSFYYRGQHGYWPEKEADFRRVAEEVLTEYRDSPRTHTYVAQYLYQGLDAVDRAIEVLFAAHRRGLLDGGGLEQLIGYLFEQSRYAESIALLEPLVDRSPDRLDLRVNLMTAYFKSMRPGQLQELIAATDTHFHADGRWTEANIAAFAQGCLEVNESQRAAGYYEEAINLRQRTAANRGIGDGRLSEYYAKVSAAYAQLGDTRRAADAAAGAIVSWGSDHTNRQVAIDSLKSVYRNAADLPAYIRLLDEEAAKSGEDSPVLRKALGQVLREREDFAGAAVQLRLALDLQPGDREVHEALFVCYDRLGDRPAVIRQLLAQINIDRHNLEAYRYLAEKTRDDSALSERAATSIVEAAPNEAEHHQSLAKLREQQDRWTEALPHWRRVSELRRLEPTGLLGLAAAQVHLQQWEPARESLRALRAREWPSHFGDVVQQIRLLEDKLLR